MVLRTLALTLVVALSAVQALGQGASRASGQDQLREITVLEPRLIEAQTIPGVPRADTDAETSSRLEEVTVRGQRPVVAYRLALEASRDRIFEIFNEINSDDEFDIHCRNEQRTGSRIRRRVCRPQFSRDVAGDAAGEYVDALRSNCAGGSQECIFGNPSAAQTAMSRAQGVEAAEHYKHRLLTEEIQELARESWRLRRALLEHEELRREYQEAREELRDE